MSDKMSSEQFKKYIQRKHAKKTTSKGANQLTTMILHFLNLNGCVAFRNNVMGVFDQGLALKNILSLKTVNEKTLRKALQKSYRKSHERKGVSDIIGFEKKTGRFIAIEVKYGKDQLSIYQTDFLRQVTKGGGIAIVAKTYDQFVHDFQKQQDEKTNYDPNCRNSK